MIPAMSDGHRFEQLHPDLQAIDAMLTAAIDHASSLQDQLGAGTELRSRANGLRLQLHKASALCTWFAIDTGLVAPEAVSPTAATNQHPHPVNGIRTGRDASRTAAA